MSTCVTSALCDGHGRWCAKNDSTSASEEQEEDLCPSPPAYEQMSVVCLCVSLCVRHGAHASQARGARWSHGFRQLRIVFRNGVDRGMVTLIRVCERGMRCTSRACREHENEAS